MALKKKLTRRSFFKVVSSSMIASTTALSACTGMTDGDPTDLPGLGRGSQSGFTDRDPNDTSGNGRGSGFSDSDSSDPLGNGRGTTPVNTPTSPTSPSAPTPPTNTGVDADGKDPNSRGRPQL